MTTILLDIEGTTTPITFVYDELFPYARREMKPFFAKNANDPRLVEIIDVLRQEAEAEKSQGEDAPQIRVEGSTEEIAADAATFALWQMDKDRKATGLKSVQGWIWDAGYASGELRGVVYDDVPEAMERWTNNGHRVAIYSSGSIAAQKLIFGFSTAGDLTKYIVGYFDTTTGPKKEAGSYTKIAHSLSVAPQDVIFCSDNIDEIRAAHEAGLQTRLTVRPGNAPIEAAHNFRVVQDFSAASVDI